MKNCKRALEILFLAFLFCYVKTVKAQDYTVTRLEFTRKAGFQLGYAYTGLHKIDAGANYYWTIAQGSGMDWAKGTVIFHTIGPSVGPNVLFVNGRAIVGMQAGVNYHLYYPVCPRINVHYENYFNGDQRIGAELGISCAGFFTYAGYYPAIGSHETTGVTTFRFGLRFVFNLVLIDAAPPQ